MISVSRLTDIENDHDIAHTCAVLSQPTCYALTVFTLHYREVRDFYVGLLNAQVVSEKIGRSCELEMAGITINLRQADQGELVSYFHLQLALKRPEPVLAELRRRGIIVTSVGPFTNFRDPEGRVIKLSEERVSSL